ncbi:MAG TPA: metallophosphoesterase [Micromonosporaceae bacterium]|nr:metallophosphoesterase [Micromonosporaceae bacterium]
MLQLLGFVGVATLVLGVIHLYLWRRLVRDTLPAGRARRVMGFVLLGLALLVPVTMIAPEPAAPWLAWVGYIWLAIMFYLLVLLAVLELPMLVARLWLRRRRPGLGAPVAVPEPALVGAGSPPGEPPGAVLSKPPTVPPGAAPAGHDPDRRLLLARGAAIFAGLTAAGVTGYGIPSALRTPVVDRVVIPLAKLDRRADGLRIALVSDIHLGPVLGRRSTERVVNVINGLDADLVAVVGDLVDGTVEELGPAAAPLRGLRSRYGTFFVTGNHEYYSGYEPWIDEVARLGMRPLRNERVEIVHRGAALDLAGVNDVAGRDYGDGPDFARALDGRDPSRPVVLLAHQPIQAFEAARHGVDLQLSGHTHGGQLIPFNLLVKLQQPVVSGLGMVDGTPVYVTDGAGFWGPPVRVGVPPEITLVELRAS